MKMAGASKFGSERRAQRVTFRSIVSATIRLENGRQLSGKIQTLSSTGGLLDLARCLDERIEISLLFRLGSAMIQAKAQMLFPMRGGMGFLQPFHFTSLAMKERQAIETEVANLLKQNFASDKSARGAGFRPSFYLDTF